MNLHSFFFKSLCSMALFFFMNNATAQRVGIGTTTPQAKLEVKNATKADVRISSNNYIDTSQLILSNRTVSDLGTDFRITSVREEGLRISSASDLPQNNVDPIIMFRPTGQIGINMLTPTEKLDVAGNIKADTVKPAALKLAPNAGSGKVLTSDAAGNASWQNAGPGSSSVGFGAWGDCATNAAISEYNPVVDSSGQIDDWLGYSASISGNFAIAGAPLDDIGANGNQGSASIFWFNGNKWVYMQKITDATGKVSDEFGTSVAISGIYAIVGSPYGGNISQGAANLFQYNGTNWVLMQKITDATGGAGQLFGSSVSISGNYAIVGARNGGNIGQGAASLYQYNGTSWVLMQKITQGSGAAGDNFGSSVSISGNLAIVGAPFDDVGANSNQGSASIFSYNGTSWTQIRYILDAAGAANDNLGNSVCISGDYAIIGASGDAVGSNFNQGSASIYHAQAGWSLMQKVTEANGNAGDSFGNSVSVSDNYAVIGSNNAAVGANTSQGKTHIYLKLGTFWQKLQVMIDPAGEATHRFGSSVAFDPLTKKFIVGAFFAFGTAGKVIFGKIN